MTTPAPLLPMQASAAGLRYQGLNTQLLGLIQGLNSLRQHQAPYLEGTARHP